jgi:1-deoxy-D-xylulose-5-phosphate reductoisomerase
VSLSVAVLGSTGSIGRQALQVAARFPERLRITALAAGSNRELLAEQAATFDVPLVALAAEDAASELANALPGREVRSGADGVVSLASSGADVILNALVGAAGLRATLAALDAGSTLALANKESLVVGGELVTSRAPAGRLIPVDSEHSALFQCMVGEDPRRVDRMWLTASGGPFRGWDRPGLEKATLELALAHPRWTMGPKITIDSATLMNKGLEAIEAHHLFGLPFERIRVVVHPQSCVHSMVEFVDGSVKAHLGATDMRIPIQYALSFPDRWDAPVEPVDFATIGSLDFEEPDLDTFGCLRLALEAGRAGGTVPAAMNAANEVAVAAFLDGRCRFLDIERVVEGVMSSREPLPLSDLDVVLQVDAEAREQAHRVLETLLG